MNAADERASELEAAAERLASVKLASDELRFAREERREKRRETRIIILGLFVALPGIIGACVGGANMVKLDTTHDLVNSRMTELLEIVGKKSHAEGVVEGRNTKGK